MFTIAIDGRGGDRGYKPILDSLDKYKDEVNWIVVTDDIGPYKAYKTVHSNEVFKTLVQTKCDACISAGDTAAYLLSAIRYLDRFALRTPLLTLVPSLNGPKVLLDVGANINCTAQHLVQFAALGMAYARLVLDIHDPKVGFLNIGTEDYKGYTSTKDARKLFEARYKKSSFIEPDGIFDSSIDVIVADGYSGNLVIKTSAAVSNFIKSLAKRESKFIQLLAYPLLSKLSQSISPVNYNTGLLMGLEQLVIKAHGNSSEKAFTGTLVDTLEICKFKRELTNNTFFELDA